MDEISSQKRQFELEKKEFALEQREKRLELAEQQQNLQYQQKDLEQQKKEIEFQRMEIKQQQKELEHQKRLLQEQFKQLQCSQIQHQYQSFIQPILDRSVNDIVEGVGGVEGDQVGSGDQGNNNPSSPQILQKQHYDEASQFTTSFLDDLLETYKEQLNPLAKNLKKAAIQLSQKEEELNDKIKNSSCFNCENSLAPQPLLTTINKCTQCEHIKNLEIRESTLDINEKLLVEREARMNQIKESRHETRHDVRLFNFMLSMIESYRRREIAIDEPAFKQDLKMNRILWEMFEKKHNCKVQLTLKLVEDGNPTHSITSDYRNLYSSIDEWLRPRSFSLSTPLINGGKPFSFPHPTSYFVSPLDILPADLSFTPTMELGGLVDCTRHEITVKVIEKKGY